MHPPLTKAEIKAMLIKAVYDAQGCKATELVAQINFHGLQNQEVPQLIVELVADGELVEVEYVLPTIPYRIKSFLLPQGSQVGPVQKEG